MVNLNKKINNIIQKDIFKVNNLAIFLDLLKLEIKDCKVFKKKNKMFIKGIYRANINQRVI